MPSASLVNPVNELGMIKVGKKPLFRLHAPGKPNEVFPILLEKG